jgi:DNA polymerase-3 subunit beta
MDCEYTGEPMTIAFNHQYLLDGLAALDGPVAVLSFTEPKKPAIMSPAGEDGQASSSYRYLIMPVRIGG